MQLNRTVNAMNDYDVLEKIIKYERRNLNNNLNMEMNK